MANAQTVTQCMKYLSLDLQDKAVTDEFIEMYRAMLEDLPDEVLKNATLECIRTCTFFPTIAEIRKKSEPFLQEWSLKNRKALETNEFSKCEGNVEYVNNYPTCKLEDSKEKCRFGGTGLCQKWDTRWR